MCFKIRKRDFRSARKRELVTVGAGAGCDHEFYITVVLSCAAAKLAIVFL